MSVYSTLGDLKASLGGGPDEDRIRFFSSAGPGCRRVPWRIRDVGVLGPSLDGRGRGCRSCCRTSSPTPTPGSGSRAPSTRPAFLMEGLATAVESGATGRRSSRRSPPATSSGRSRTPWAPGACGWAPPRTTCGWPIWRPPPWCTTSLTAGSRKTAAVPAGVGRLRSHGRGLRPGPDLLGVGWDEFYAGWMQSCLHCSDRPRDGPAAGTAGGAVPTSAGRALVPPAVAHSPSRPPADAWSRCEGAFRRLA